MTILKCKIKTHKQGKTYDQPHFFILNKGLNSGKPLGNPCPNCFVITTDTKEDRELLFYICLSLKIGQLFSLYLVGSVIAFIRINDVRDVLNSAINNYNKEQWELKVEKLKKLIEYEDNLTKQLATIAQLKVALLRT